jgi:hypothetical protein
VRVLAALTELDQGRWGLEEWLASALLSYIYQQSPAVYSSIREKRICQMRVRYSSAALLLAFAVLALAFDVSPALASSPGNSGNAQACQQDGWQLLQTANGRLFRNAGECSSYGAHGGVLMAAPTLVVSATIGFCGGPEPHCWGAFTGTGLAPFSPVYLHYTFAGMSTAFGRNANASGSISSAGPNGWLPGEGIFACGGVVSNVYATGTTGLGEAITSNVIANSPC